MPASSRKAVGTAIVVVVAVVVVGLVGWRLLQGEEAAERGGPQAAPVEVAEVVVGEIQERRLFGGTLESPARVTVSAQAGGRVTVVAADLGDEVERGQVVVQLDDAVPAAEARAAEAELRVAQANLNEANSALEIATRSLDRARTLQGRGVVSDADYDSATSTELAARTRVDVASAEVGRAEAALESAKVQLGYSEVRADWPEEDSGIRVIAERLVEPGDTVSADSPVMTIVQLDPLRAVINVTERDYASLEAGQTVSLVTDAFPGETFEASVARVSPVFDEASRQARVELTVPNDERKLKPGLFVRATATLATAADAILVPQAALTQRGGRSAIFALRERDGGLVADLLDVETGISDGGMVQLLNVDGLNAGDRVVVLGQQLLDDGSAASVPEVDDPSTEEEGE